MLEVTVRDLDNIWPFSYRCVRCASFWSSIYVNSSWAQLQFWVHVKQAGSGGPGPWGKPYVKQDGSGDPGPYVKQAGSGGPGPRGKPFLVGDLIFICLFIGICTAILFIYYIIAFRYIIGIWVSTDKNACSCQHPKQPESGPPLENVFYGKCPKCIKVHPRFSIQLTMDLIVSAP